VTLLLMNLLLSIVVDAYSNAKADQGKSDADTESIGASSFVWISMVWTDARHSKAAFGGGGGAAGAKARLAAAGGLVPFFESPEALFEAQRAANDGNRGAADGAANGDRMGASSRLPSVTDVALAGGAHGAAALRMRFKGLARRVTTGGKAAPSFKPRDGSLRLPEGLGLGAACVEIRTTKQCRALLDELGLPQWKIGSMMRSVTIRRVKQLKRAFTPVENKVDALSEGVDEMRKALYFVQNQLPKEQLMALSFVHSNLDLRLGDVEGKLQRLHAIAIVGAAGGGGAAR